MSSYKNSDMPNYKSFTIENFKGIEKEITISVEKNKLIPIVGINESGKTTILEAINMLSNIEVDFEKLMDKLLLSHQSIFYNKHDNKSKDLPSIISTIISIEKSDVITIVSNVTNDPKYDLKRNPFKTKVEKLDEAHGEVEIKIQLSLHHNDQKPSYSINIFKDIAHKYINEISRKVIIKIMEKIPSIIYLNAFDDELFQSPISINKNSTEEGYKIVNRIIDRYNYERDDQINIFKIAASNDINALNNNVSDYISSAITEEWRKFWKSNNPNADIMQVDSFSVEFTLEISGKQRNERKVIFKIKEKVGNKFAFFDLRERSKGFIWFFNYVLKTRFNPNFHGEGNRKIYLLDEPGAYLHGSGQEEFCNNLKKLSDEDTVIFTTHSIYMLNPNYINRNSILVAERDQNGLIKCKKATEYSTDSIDKNYKVVYDALKLTYSANLDFHPETKILLVEGIYDYFLITYMLKDKLNNEKIKIVLTDGAGSSGKMANFINGMGVKWLALFDNDEKGKAGYNSIRNTFLSSSKNEKQIKFIESRLHLLDYKKDGYSTKDNGFESHHLICETNRQDLKNKFNVPTKDSIVDMFYDNTDKFTPSEETKSNFCKLFNIIKQKFASMEI